MSRRPASLALSLAMVATLLLGACSSTGGDDDKATDKTTSTTKGGDDTTSTTGDDTDDTSTTETPTEPDDVEVSGDAKAYVEAMTASMAADEEFGATDEQAECFAERTVDTIGADRLKEAGVSPEQFAGDADDADDTLDFAELGLSEDDANTIYDHLGDCDIDLRQMMMDSMADDDDVTPQVKACFEAAFTDENLRKLMVATMMQGSEAAETDPELSPLMAQMIGCAFMGMGDTTAN